MFFFSSFRVGLHSGLSSQHFEIRAWSFPGQLFDSNRGRKWTVVWFLSRSMISETNGSSQKLKSYLLSYTNNSLKTTLNTILRRLDALKVIYQILFVKIWLLSHKLLFSNEKKWYLSFPNFFFLKLSFWKKGDKNSLNMALAIRSCTIGLFTYSP